LGSGETTEIASDPNRFNEKERGTAGQINYAERKKPDLAPDRPGMGMKRRPNVL